MKIEHSGPRCPTGAFLKQRRNAPKRLERPRERGWEKRLLRIAFGACSDIEVHSDISSGQAQAAVLRAAETWNAAGLALRIDATDDLTEADIVVAWKFASADPEGTLSSQTQAHADFPPGNSLFGPPPLPIHFNADFLWGIEAAGRFDVETIALHELGHCLGLVYHSGIDTIMYDALREAPFFVRHQLDPETLSRIEQLYQFD
jgi:predicted Zn-dependent protease